ncbi:MAG TPA: hypothetical protein VN673_15765 [Clostridia bacterium]|nr:hypothetical protein [Clostridia bacterium]
MKGFSIAVTILLFVAATYLADWLHAKQALPEQTGERAVVKKSTVPMPRHLQPSLKI